MCTQQLPWKRAASRSHRIQSSLGLAVLLVTLLKIWSIIANTYETTDDTRPERLVGMACATTVSLALVPVLVVVSSAADPLGCDRFPLGPGELSTCMRATWRKERVTGRKAGRKGGESRRMRNGAGEEVVRTGGVEDGGSGDDTKMRRMRSSFGRDEIVWHLLGLGGLTTRLGVGQLLRNLSGGLLLGLLLLLTEARVRLRLGEGYLVGLWCRL